MSQAYESSAIVVVKTKKDPGLLAVPLRQTILEFDRNLPVADMMTMEQNVAQMFAESKAATGALELFGLLASTLAGVGLYGVLATFVNQRRREFGVRSALGATPRDIRGLVLRESLRLTAIGAGLGLLISFGFSRVLASMLPGLTALDPAIYASAALVTAVMTMLSTLIPSRAASRMDSMLALRCE